MDRFLMCHFEQYIKMLKRTQDLSLLLMSLLADNHLYILDSGERLLLALMFMFVFNYTYQTKAIPMECYIILHCIYFKNSKTDTTRKR